MHGRRRQGRWCWVRSAPLPTVDVGRSTPADVAQIGYAIGKKVGNAVVRNRIRRRLRPIIAEYAADLDPGIYLVGVKNDRAARISYEELRNDLRSVLAAAAPSAPSGSLT